MSFRTTPQGIILTEHAQQSLLRHGFQEPFELVDDIIENYTRRTTQSDGATVYIQRTVGRSRRYNIVIEGDEGIVTGMRNIDPPPSSVRELGSHRDLSGGGTTTRRF